MESLIRTWSIVLACAAGACSSENSEKPRQEPKSADSATTEALSPPHAKDLTFSAKPGEPLVEKLMGEDPTGAPLTFELSSMPSQGTVTIAADTGEFTYLPDPSATQEDSFTYYAISPYGESAPAKVKITFAAPPQE